VNIPDHVRRHIPRRFGAAPFFLQARAALFLFANRVELAGFDAALDGQAVDPRQLVQVLPQLSFTVLPEKVASAVCDSCKATLASLKRAQTAESGANVDMSARAELL